MQLGSYSTSEQATRYKWTDGKIIYSRTFGGTITQAANVRSELPLMSDVSTLISSEGWWAESPTGFKIPSGQPWLAGGGSIFGASSFRLSNLGVVDFLSWLAAARTNAPYLVTIYYTKT